MPKIKRILQYRCLACGNLSSLPLECCGDQMVSDPLDGDETDEDFYFTIEDQLLDGAWRKRL